jgi:hypothetical protein
MDPDHFPLHCNRLKFVGKQIGFNSPNIILLEAKKEGFDKAPQDCNGIQIRTIQMYPYEQVAFLEPS